MNDEVFLAVNKALNDGNENVRVAYDKMIHIMRIYGYVK